MKSQNHKTMEHLLIENKAAKLRLNETVHKDSMDRITEEIRRVFGAQAFAAGDFTGEITNCIENAADTMDIEIHSPGGSVFDGYTLYNEILNMRQRGVYVTAYITLAASMASVIAMAADKVVMREGGRMMIHEAKGGAQGDADELAKYSNLLESISSEIAVIYSNRTGIAQDEIRAMMKKETWMDADQAVTAGFADAKFDRPTKSKAMNIIDRLTSPSESEAKERIVALEAQIEANDVSVGEFQAKLEIAEASLQEASTELVALKSQKDEIEAKFNEQAELLAVIQAKHDELVAQSAAEIAKLTEEAEETKEKIEAKASEILSESGHPAPVALDDDNVKPIHLATFKSLKGAEATAYFKAHQKAIAAEQKAAIQ